MPTASPLTADQIFAICPHPITKPLTIAQAERMTAAVILMAIGGEDSFEVVYRHRIKEVSTRQIARDNRCKRGKVREICRRFDGAMATLQGAIDGAGLEEMVAPELVELEDVAVELEQVVEDWEG